MGDVNYLVPQDGIIEDTEEGNNSVNLIPDAGCYQQQEAAGGPAGLSIPRPLSRPFSGPLGGI